MAKKRIAVVGSGISGLSTLWTLRKTDCVVHLFEKDSRLGGHTNTVTWHYNGKSTPVDTGFIVMNSATYPNFLAFLQELGIQTIRSEMTFGISRDRGAFEWSGTSLSALFAQPGNALKPTFWRMIFDIIRFNQFSLDLLSSNSVDDLSLSIGEYLEREGYSEAFRDDYLIPMTACVWSTGADKCALEFPALTLVRFLWNHHLLNTVAERPPWLTINGGSKMYIDALMKDCSTTQVHLSTEVTRLTRKNGKIQLFTRGPTEGAQEEEFDEVVLACHGDQARWILGTAATQHEMGVLSAFETTPNIAYLHRDLSLMPTRRAAWSAWNYLTSSTPAVDSPPKTSGNLQTVSLTYNMNILQSLAPAIFGDILVTLNPEVPPSSLLTQATYQYRHPLYNAGMVAAQERLEQIQGNGGVWYAGAWTGYGFHEDGFASGMRVGLRLGGDVPWQVQNAKFMRGVTPVFGWKDYVVRLVVLMLQGWITFVERLFRVKWRRTSEAGLNGSVRLNGSAKTKVV